MKIVLDAMGGDNAPGIEIEGAALAVKEYSDINLVLVGKENQIRQELEKHALNTAEKSRLEIINADEVITMSEAPAQAFKQKPGSSIAVCARLLKEEKADALVSAGNTGAVVVASLLGIGRIPGVIRPAILTPMPSKSGVTAVLDAGANVDCKPEHLAQFAIMGDLYAKHILGIENPRVGIISVGEEEEKGNNLTWETRQLISGLKLNFKGNVEGRDVTNGNADVIVCDGFVGNVILKTAEGVAHLLFSMIKSGIKNGGIISGLGALLIKGVFKGVLKRTDPNEYGGAPLLGIKKPVIITHGSSNAKGIKNAVGVAAKFVNRHINEEIAKAVKTAEGKSE